MLDEYEALQAKMSSLLNKEASAKVRYEENKVRYETAKAVFAKENDDVEKLQEESLSTFLKRLIGNYDKKLNKEKQEQVTAKMELDLSLALLLESREDLDAIQTTSKETSSQIKRLKEILYQKDSHFRERVTIEEMNRANLKQELIEIDEALAAGESVLSAIDIALDDLDSADSYSTWDMFTDSSLLFDIMKYDKIDKAEAKIGKLEQQLEHYSKELKDLSMDTILSYEKFSGMSKTFDIFFDNLFSDWDTKSKIGRNIEMLENLSLNIEDLQTKLDNNKKDIQKQLEESEKLY
ncbi:hypothetical protein [Desemzia sp. RIT 804]|uniref:hypothetical protein n=1 Tax=Desemzia sp. RIT 804 TaxID=2810209 RepID=UPI001F19867D|nr:hypothetical protein [Desemzia sp. RIT 804]